MAARTTVGRLFERRTSLNNPNVPLTDATLTQWLDGPPVNSGVNVSEHLSLSITAVYRAVALIAGTCASLPLKAYRTGSVDEVPRSILVKPNQRHTPIEFFETLFTQLLLWGNAYIYKVRNGAGMITELWPIHPARVDVRVYGQPNDRLANALLSPGEKVFLVNDAYDSGLRGVFTPLEMTQIPGLSYDGRMGLPPIRLAREAIGLGLATQEYAARFYGSGTQLSGLLTTDVTLDNDKAEAIKTRWRNNVAGLRNAHDIAVLDSGAKFQPLSMPAKDAELLASRQFTVTEIARLFGIPNHMLGDQTNSTSWGSGIQEQVLGFQKFTLVPWLRRVEQRFTADVILDQQVYTKFDLTELLSGTPREQADLVTSKVNAGLINREEGRKVLGVDPAPQDGLDLFLVASNMTVIDKNGELIPAKTGGMGKDLVDEDTGLPKAEPQAPTTAAPTAAPAPATPDQGTSNAS